MDVFRKALEVLKRVGAKVASVRLDKYYSLKTIIERFGRKVSPCLIPSENIVGVLGENLDENDGVVGGFLSAYSLGMQAKAIFLQTRDGSSG